MFEPQEDAAEASARWVSSHLTQSAELHTSTGGAALAVVVLPRCGFVGTCCDKKPHILSGAWLLAEFKNTGRETAREEENKC